MTLRVKEETLKGLMSESTQKGVPLNALVNMIFEEFLEVHSPALKSDLVYVPKKLLQELLREIPDEKIPAIAAHAGLENVTCMMQNGTDTNSMLQTLTTLAKYSGYSCVDTMTEDSKRTISLTHQMGIKYSKLLQSCLEHAFADRKISTVHFDISESRMSMTIESTKHRMY